LYRPAGRGYKELSRRKDRLNASPEDVLQRAGFWIRALAAGLDLLAGGVVVAGGILLTILALEWLDASDELAEYLGPIVLLVLVLAYTSTEVWLAATPGKLVLRLRIGTSAGTPAGRWTRGLRWSSKYAGFLFWLIHAITLDPLTHFLSGWMNLVVLVGCLQALDEDRRTWHDEWAGTAVLRLRPLARPPGGFPVTPPLLSGGADAGRV
jgi:uncharacterized RDD family membrane protein YckC